MAQRARIAGWGKALPQRVLTNFELEKMVDTTDEWIRTRTGIAERRIAGPHDSTFSLATRAARDALAIAGIEPNQVDLIIVCTMSPEFGGMPSTASLVQDAIGAERAGALDLNAACSGFVYGLAMGRATVMAGLHQNVLVIGAETMSRLVDWKDRATCVLFGDGAGAVLLQPSQGTAGVLSCVLGSDGSGGELLCIPAGGSRRPSSLQTVQEAQHFLRMNGKEVYKFAVTTVPRSAAEALRQAGMGVDDLDLFIPHQANIRIIRSAAETLGVPMEKVFTNVERYGNTSAASIPLALCEAVELGRIHDGDTLLLAGFGGGLSWGAAVVEWGVPTAAERHAANGLLNQLRDTVVTTRSLTRKTVRRLDSLLLDARWDGGIDRRTGNSLDAPPPAGKD